MGYHTACTASTTGPQDSVFHPESARFPLLCCSRKALKSAASIASVHWRSGGFSLSVSVCSVAFVVGFRLRGMVVAKGVGIMEIGHGALARIMFFHYNHMSCLLTVDEIMAKSWPNNGQIMGPNNGSLFGAKQALNHTQQCHLDPSFLVFHAIGASGQRNYD